MAKYAKVGRFLKEDFGGSPSWFETFLQQLNRFKEQVEQIIDRRITVNDNMAGEIRELTFETGPVVSDSFPMDFKSAVGKVRVVVCGGAVDVTGEEIPVTAPRLAWTYDGTQVIITGAASGDLLPNTKYRLQILTFVN